MPRYTRAHATSTTINGADGSNDAGQARSRPNIARRSAAPIQHTSVAAT